MADYHFGPYHYVEDISEVFNGTNEYFLHGGQAFRITGKHFDDDDQFYVDFIRSYSFIATEFKATVHMRAQSTEDGGTDLTFDIKSQDDEDRLEKNLCQRIYRSIQAQIDNLEGKSLPTVEKTEEEKKKDKRNLIIGLVVAAAIVIGAIPISLNPGNWGL